MNALVITGASSFLGHALISTLPTGRFSELRLLVHETPPPLASGTGGTILRGDLRYPDMLHDLVSPGATVVHLAFLASARPEEDNLAATRNLLSVCKRTGIRRLIHCSTAVVAGNVPESVVTETTPCQPASRYERTKLAVERLVIEESMPGMEVVVLRPTAVFGPGGRNLVKLADSLLRPGFGNYAASCLQGRRRMNLVHVDNVAAALRFLIDTPGAANGEIYIVSDDESPLNNYLDVEERLARGLGVSHFLPRITLPRFALQLARKLAGRLPANLERTYDGSKIVRAGLQKPVSFEEGLDAFARWYRSQHLGRTLTP